MPSIGGPSIGSDFADEVRLEGAGGVVPLEALVISVPQFETVLFFAVLVAEVVRLSGVPVHEGEGSAVSHPEEVAFLRQVGTRCPEVLAAVT